MLRSEPVVKTEPLVNGKGLFLVNAYLNRNIWLKSPICREPGEKVGQLRIKAVPNPLKSRPFPFGFRPIIFAL